LGAVTVIVPVGNAPGGRLADSASTQEDAAASAERMQKQLDAELADLRNAREALRDAVAKLQQLQDRFKEEAEKQLVTLSLEIAEKVLVQEIKADRYQIDPIVQEVMRRVSGRADIVVHLHPQDLARSELAKQAEGDQNSSGVRFVADPAVKRAECLLRVPDGAVQSSIGENLAAVAEALANTE
jgi:flagellar assembly protein FliH